MDATTRNKEIINKYKQLVVANYKEPGQDCMFKDDCTKDVLQELQQKEDSDSEEQHVNKLTLKLIKAVVLRMVLNFAVTLDCEQSLFRIVERARIATLYRGIR